MPIYNPQYSTTTPTASTLPLWDSNLNLTANRFIPYSNRASLSGASTLTATSAQYQFLDPNGANRDVNLPTAATNMLYIIKNIGTGGYTLTVKDSGGSAITGGTIANNVAMGFYYDGTAWQLV